jgi:NAD(P)H-dependent FMN reductase
VTRIIGLSGSLRKGSFNSALLRAAAASTSDGTEIEIASIRGIPLYDGDVEAADGIPPLVRDLKDRITSADALLLATPEYNNGVPGVFKNAIDWLSRPPADIPRVFGGRPVALIGASPGAFGTALAQEHWLSTLRALGTRPWFGGRILVARAHHAFNEAGELVEENVRKQLRDFVHGFAEFIRSGAPARR